MNQDEGKFKVRPSTILLVEDEPDLQTIFALFLNRAGFKVIPAFNGDEAIRQLEEVPLDLIVTDLMMPKMDGWEFIQIVKQNPIWQKTPIVIMSAGIVSRVNIPPHDAFLRKPFTLEQLSATLRKVLSMVKH